MRIAIILPLALLAACGSGSEQTTIPLEEESPTATAVPPMQSPVRDEAAEGTSPTLAAADIPSAIRGRWGMVPADCEPGRADAKGLLVIGAKRLEFYESVGTLQSLQEQAPTRLRGSFAFTGEGMEWQRDVTLDVQDGGRTLIRSEAGDGAEPGPFRYTKCA